MGSIRPLSSEAALSTLQVNPKEKLEKNKPGNNKVEEPSKSLAEFSANSDAVVLDASLGTKTSEAAKEADSNENNFQELYKALSLTGKEIVDKINEQLKISLPEGVQSLKPEDVTPERTADRIVSGVTAFFDIYAKQKSNLSGDELVDSFISEVQKGVGEGYSDAFRFLEGIGAFKVEGVQAGIEKTRSLIDEKLLAFATQKKTELSGKDSESTPKTDTPATTPINILA